MEVPIFNMAYALREKEGWFSIRDLVQEYAKKPGSALCLKIYQARSPKIQLTVESFMENFIDKVELGNFLASFEAYEHYLDKNYKVKEVCNYVVIRCNNSLDSALLEHIESYLSTSKQFRCPMCILVNNEEILPWPELVVHPDAMVLGNVDFVRRYSQSSEAEESILSEELDKFNLVVCDKDMNDQSIVNDSEQIRKENESTTKRILILLNGIWEDETATILPITYLVSSFRSI